MIYFFLLFLHIGIYELETTCRNGEWRSRGSEECRRFLDGPLKVCSYEFFNIDSWTDTEKVGKLSLCAATMHCGQ